MADRLQAPGSQQRRRSSAAPAPRRLSNVSASGRDRRLSNTQQSADSPRKDHHVVPHSPPINHTCNWIEKEVSEPTKSNATIGDLQQLWLRYDYTKDSALDKREFRLFYNDYQAIAKQPATDADFEKLWRELHEFARDGDRAITWNEFCDFFSIYIPDDQPVRLDAPPQTTQTVVHGRGGRRTVSRVATRQVDWVAKLGLEKGDHKPSTQELVELWKHYDTDRSGTLDRNEFRQFYFSFASTLLKKVPTENGFNAFWSEFDDDGSGCIDFTEFLEIFGIVADPSLLAAAAPAQPQQQGPAMILAYVPPKTSGASSKTTSTKHAQIPHNASTASHASHQSHQSQAHRDHLHDPRQPGPAVVTNGAPTTGPAAAAAATTSVVAPAAAPAAAPTQAPAASSPAAAKK